MKQLYPKMRSQFVLRIFLIATLLFSTLVTYAQVSGVNRSAGNNSSHRSSGGGSSSSSSGSSGGYCPSDDDDEDWAYGSSYNIDPLCSECLGCMATSFSNFKTNNQLLISRSKSDGMPWVQGVELMFQGSYGPTKYKPIFIKPELRINYGKLTTQMRITFLKDETGEAPSFDWQILVFNIVNEKYMNLRFGHGLMLEEASGLAHYETTAGMEFHFEDHKYNPIIEYRLAFDPVTTAVPRQEWNLRFDYKLFSKDKTHFHLSGGYIYQNYYQRYRFHMVQAGLNIGIY